MMIAEMIDMNNFRDKFLCVILLVCGLYCLIQGVLLTGSDNPLAMLLGYILWLWVPGCVYFTLKGAKSLKALIPQAAQSQPRHGVEIVVEGENGLCPE